MTPPLAQLETWMKALEQYAQALADYVVVIDAAARKSRPAARAAYQKVLADSATISADLPQGDGVTLVERAFALFARFEGIREGLDDVAVAALDPTLLDESTRRMSRTYVEGIETKTRALRAAKAVAATVEETSGSALARAWASRAAAGDPADVARVYTASAKSVAGATLFAAALVEWERAGKDVQAFAEGAKDEALGIPPDTPEAVARDTVARAGMHPLQAMGSTFGLRPVGETEARGALIIDVTLPQANTAVRYDIAPLVDVRAATKFGPLANIFTGLNYHLVDRLRTITEEAIPAGDRHPAAITTGPGSGVVRTTNGGSTFQVMQGLLPPEAYATAGAGPRPRVSQLGALLEDAVYSDTVPAADGPPRTIEDPEKLLERYDDQVDDIEPYISLDKLGQTFLQKFAARYDTVTPTTGEEFKALILGAGGGRDPFRTYIAQAISEVSKQGTEKRLLTSEAYGARGSSILFGGRSLAARGARQEALLTSLVQLRQAISAAIGQLSRAYDRMGIDSRAREVFGPANDAQERGRTAQIAQRSRQRMKALALYRAVVEEAFYASRKRQAGRAARAIEKLGAVEPRPSLKLYVLVRGDTSAAP